ncbi:MAG: OmpA family protein [Rhodobacteraceae bacterium]|nr:OmpA family protein [Paracoccaceae bacterium]
MAGGGSNAPVIVRRRKVVAGGGHHGGAWKVAYADFVTAMMAFFMLMWLLNATTEKQRKGIADYFNPTIPVNRISGGGDGAFGGTSIFSEVTLAQNGLGASNRYTTDQLQARGQTGVDPQEQAKTGDAATPDAGVTAEDPETEALRRIEQMLLGKGGESMVTDLLARHITTRLTDEGLIVEVFDIEGAPLFAEGTAEPEPVLREIAAMLVEVFGLVRNPVAVNGHVKAEPEVLKVNPTWDLSTGRAQAARALLEAEGLDAARVVRVTGHADRRPVAPNPMAVRNNRIELVLIRSDAR